jgi:pantoate--beta-alanine ligase
MVRDLNVPVELILAPLVRETDGLALSSRNKYLSPEERQQALNIYKGLQQAEEAFRQGCRDAEELITPLRQRITEAGGKIDYVEVMAQATLRPLTMIDQPALLAVAAFFGKTRLIDNLFLEV